MIFKTTYNIFNDQKEYFNPNWMDSDTVILPPNPPWDYSRELQLEDVDIWEVVWEGAGNWGVYASWSPYAEFYLVCKGLEGGIETFYGKKANEKVFKRMKELNIEVTKKSLWVEDSNMWLY
jgi:hypothetical protein